MQFLFTSRHALAALVIHILLQSRVIALKLRHAKPVVDIFYESQCPYSLDLLNTTVRDAWKDQELWQALDVKFHPFGNAQMIPESNLSKGYHFWHPDAKYPVVMCQHHEMECLGNVIHNCVIDLYPEEKYVPFIVCMASVGLNAGVELLSYQCGSGLGLDMDLVKNCTDVGKGHDMVITEGELTRSTKITGVPWVLVNGEHVNESEEILQPVCDAIAGSKPSACDEVLGSNTTGNSNDGKKKKKGCEKGGSGSLLSRSIHVSTS
jgi:hypothetical protein